VILEEARNGVGTNTGFVEFTDAVEVSDKTNIFLDAHDVLLVVEGLVNQESSRLDATTSWIVD